MGWGGKHEGKKFEVVRKTTTHFGEALEKKVKTGGKRGLPWRRRYDKEHNQLLGKCCGCRFTILHRRKGRNDRGDQKRGLEMASIKL